MEKWSHTLNVKLNYGLYAENVCTHTSGTMDESDPQKLETNQYSSFILFRVLPALFIYSIFIIYFLPVQIACICCISDDRVVHFTGTSCWP